MAALSKRKTKLSVEFADTIREQGKHREIIMELAPFCMRVRLKGLRGAYEISPASVYNLAVLKAVEAKKAEAKRRKK